jgi:hypothetical protein
VPAVYPELVQDEVWIPLVDEPIGEIVARLESENEDIRRLIDSPQKLLAFRTFAYIRVGIVLGGMLVERDDAPGDGTETWVEQLAREPEVRAELLEELRAVAREVAAESGHEEPVAPDESARERFRAAAKRALDT